MGNRLDRELTLGALNMSIRQRRPGPGLLVHSDLARQYASAEYRELLAKHGIIPSMSRLGYCWDNSSPRLLLAALRLFQ